MSLRSLSLDQSALSPKEYQSYKLFISNFQSYTSSRSGRLRFAEAAQFLRTQFPFETEREDEIRRFFPQKVQLGEIDQGCVLAILRLLAHINNHKNVNIPFQLYRDLIFLQTEPLPSLPQSQQKSITLPDPPSYYHESKNLTSPSPSSNPFLSLEPTHPTLLQSSQSTILIPPKPSSSTSISRFEKSKSIPNTTASSPTSIPPQPFSGQDLHTTSLPSSGCLPNRSTSISKNPFRASSISIKSDSNQNLRPASPSDIITLPSPRIPPRPIISLAVAQNSRLPETEEDSYSPTPSKTKALPPPKHYSQIISKHSDNLQTHPEPINQLDTLPSINNQTVFPERHSLTPSASMSKLGKIIPKPKILPRLQVNQGQINTTNHIDNLPPQVHSSDHAQSTYPNEVRFSELKHTSSNSPFVTSSEYPKTSTPPPIKPMRPEKTELIFQEHNVNGVAPAQLPSTTPSMTLTRSKTLNHHRRIAPPLPPPRKLRQSLHVHNPDSVPLDQLFQLSCIDSNESEVVNEPNQSNRTREKSWINHHVKRSVSNSTSSILPRNSSNYQRKKEERAMEKEEKETEAKFIPARQNFPPRRSVSLSVQNKTNLPGTGTTTESVIDQLKAIEIGIRQDSKELVKEVKDGWRSRHGKREERVPLVTKKSDLSATTKSTNTKNNDFHTNHLGHLVPSRWKVSKHDNDDLHLVNNNLDDSLDDDQSSDSLNHKQHISKINSWHQLA